MISKTIASIMLNVAFISAFIGIFFFTYGKKVESDIVTSQSEFIAKSLADNIKIIIPIKNADEIKNEIDQIKIDLTKQDREAQENNAKLLKQACNRNWNITRDLSHRQFHHQGKMFNFAFGSIVKSNLIILMFVALTEFVFLTFVVKNPTFRQIPTTYTTKF